MKHFSGYAAIFCAAVLLTGCSAKQDSSAVESSEPAETGASVTESAETETAEPAQSDADAPQTVTKAEIVLPDLSALGIDTAAFTAADQDTIYTYNFGSPAYDGDVPTETLYVFRNPDGDEMLFDTQGRLRPYQAHQQTVWTFEPVTGTVPKTTGPDGSYGETLPPSDSSMSDPIVKPAADAPQPALYLPLKADLPVPDTSGNGIEQVFCEIDMSLLLPEFTYLEMAADALHVLVPDADRFNDEDTRTNHWDDETGTVTPCKVISRRWQASEVCDYASVELNIDGTLNSFSVQYADMPDAIAFAQLLHEKADEYTGKMLTFAKSEDYILDGHCQCINGTAYGFYTVSFYEDGTYTDKQIIVRAD